MSSTCIFVCHDLDLTEETQLEVQIFHQLCQRLQEVQAEVVTYPGRASGEGFPAFFNQQLSTCQWFLLFQTASAVHSFGVQSAVNIAKMRVEQKQMQGLLRFIALPGETPEQIPMWSTIQTFGATRDYQRAMEKLSLIVSLSLGQESEAQTDPVISLPVAVREATEVVPIAPYDQRALYNQSLIAPPPPVTEIAPPPPVTEIAPPPPVADLGTAPLSAVPVSGQNQVILPGPFSPLSLLSSSEQTQGNSPAVASSDPASMPAPDRPAKLHARLSRGQIWLSAILASILILGVLLFAVVLPLHASSSHQPGTPHASAAVPTANSTATVGAQASSTASTRGTVIAVAQATASTPQGLYVTTTKTVPNVTDPLTGPSDLKWDVLSYSGGGSCGYTGGSYHATMPQSGSFAACMAEASNYGNFLYQVRMTVLSGSGNDGGGLIFRTVGSAQCRLRVSIDGSYDLAMPGKPLTSGTSSAIKTGLNQTNLVAVAARGTTIDVYINGTLIINLTETTSSTGQIGLMGVDFSTTTVNVAYSDAQIWLL